VQFDERSREYPVRELVGAARPRNRRWRCIPHLDQGQEGACVGFAMAHELIATPHAVTVGAKFARERVYWEAQRIDEWQGGSYPGATPRYEGTSVLAGVKVLRKLGFIRSYRWAFGLEDLILAVGNAGPAVLGVNWYESMGDVESCGFLHVRGREPVGGHAILCKAVNVRHRYFVLHNSWGPSWGRNGDARISFADMERLLDEDGEAVIPVGRRKPQRTRRQWPPSDEAQ
jgi:hypothetical protein